ncbi:MAG: hypothetical protein QXT28_09755 [Thermofilaceae archaeon]
MVKRYRIYGVDSEGNEWTLAADDRFVFRCPCCNCVILVEADEVRAYRTLDDLIYVLKREAMEEGAEIVDVYVEEW